MSLQIASTFQNSNLPVLKPLGASIAAIASLKSWFQFDEQFATLDAAGKVSALVAKTGAGSMLTDTGLRPGLVASAFADDYSAGGFDAASEMYASGVTLDLSQPFTIAAIFRPVVDTANYTGYVSSRTDSTHNILLSNNKDTGLAQVAVGNVAIPSVVPVDGNVHIAVFGVNGNTLKASGDGIRKTDVAFGSGYGPGTALLRLGGLDGANAAWRAKAQFADLLLFQEDLFLTAAAARLKLVNDFARYVYGTV